MSTHDLQQKHNDNVMRAIERQRNDALTREAQKDALIALLRAQGANLTDRLNAAETRIAELETAAQEGANRKKTKAA